MVSGSLLTIHPCRRVPSMDLLDLLGSLLDIDGRRCQLLAAVPIANNGRETLFLTSVTVEASDGSHGHGAIPIVASPEPGTRPPRLVLPSAVFDETGEIREWQRPIAARIDAIEWQTAEGTPCRIESGWPRPVRVLSELEQVRAALRVPPLDDEPDLKVGGRLVRRLGVALVDADGSDRNPREILADAKRRADYIKTVYYRGSTARAYHQQLSAMIEELIAQGGGA